MVEMDHSVLGLAAKKHALILSAVFFFFFVLVIVADIIAGKAWEPVLILPNLFGLTIISHAALFFGAIALLCLLKCNAKCLVIICILWPASLAVTCLILIIGAFSSSEVTLLAAVSKAFTYIIVAASVVLLLGSIHCTLLLFTLGFCSRGGGGVDVDLYDLEKSDSQEESASSYEKDKPSIQ